jgi:N-acetylmuramic acid 6-phosphate etherase
MKKHRQQITELENPAALDLETKSALSVLRIINHEDHKVAPAVRKVLPAVARAVGLAADALARGGRLIYLGAGTSGRLGVLDAAECLPTFDTDRVQAVMAGAPASMSRPSEVSEDDPRLAVRDLRRARLNRKDVLVGISASGTTPYTLGGIRYARARGAKTVALTCNPGSPLSRSADVSIAPVMGPEIVAGSSRMKAGTAQKLVLNMISTATMVKLGRVISGRMVTLRISNRKLQERGRRIVMQAAGVTARRAALALEKSGRNIPLALLMLRNGLTPAQAQKVLKGGLDVTSILRAKPGHPAQRGERRNPARY